MEGLLSDPAHASVFLDFDGTVTTEDVGQHLLRQLGSPEWLDLHDRYARGEIGSRELLVDQWALIETPTDEERLRAVAREVPIDPGFGPLVDALRAAAAELVVVSDGFGFYVEEACAPFGVEVLTNAVDFTTGQIVFPHEDRCCPCSTCGVCKQAPIKEAKVRGRVAALVGDGVSDRKAALLADVLLAKGELAVWCDALGIPWHGFATLADVRRLLLGDTA